MTIVLSPKTGIGMVRALPIEFISTRLISFWVLFV